MKERERDMAQNDGRTTRNGYCMTFVWILRDHRLVIDDKCVNARTLCMINTKAYIGEGKGTKPATSDHVAYPQPY